MADVGWRTIKGSHVYIGEGGAVTEGHASLKGKNINNLHASRSKEKTDEAIEFWKQGLPNEYW